MYDLMQNISYVLGQIFYRDCFGCLPVEISICAKSKMTIWKIN